MLRRLVDFRARMAVDGPRWTDSRLLIATHVAALILLSITAFPRNRANLLHDYDGSFYRTTVKLQYEWTSWSPHLGGNPLSALGNSLFCVQTLASPGHAIGAILGGGEVRAVATYTVIALELFLAVLFLGASLRLDRTLTLSGAWLLTLGALPFVDRAQWYPLARIAPVLFEFIAAQLVMIGAFHRVGKDSGRAAAGSAILLAVAAVWAVVCSPMGIILCAPALALYFTLLTAAASDRRERHLKLFALGGLAALAAPTMIPYFLGSFLNSVPTFFSKELENDRLEMYWVSGIFRRGGFGWLYAPFGVVALAGAIRTVARERGPFLTIASATLLQFVAALAVGVPVVLWRLPYVGPSPLYFEIYIWPFYALLACSLGLEVFHRLPLPRPSPSSWLHRAGTLLTPAALLPVAALAASMTLKAPPLRTLPYPPAETEIVRHLKESIGMTPGRDFRGSVATFTGVASRPGGVGWLDLHQEDLELGDRTGNELRAMGLWYHGLPTLHEYNQFMTPPYYVMLSRLLARPQDRQMRSVIVLTQPHAPYLASLGVRFVITDLLLEGPGIRLDLTDRETGFRLYEMSNPNLGAFSPTVLRVEPQAAGAIARLRFPGFAFADEAVAEQPLPTPLVKATEVRFLAERGGWSVEAKSSGRSLLLLPLQYSRCLDLDVLSGSEVRLERVNLMQAGLLFSGALKVRIRFASGPFHNPWGRLRDYRDLKRLGFRELVRD